MASINVGINPTPDPNYINTSRGTDNAQLQPLASVPELSTKYVQPDYKENRAAGTAVKAVGDLAEAGLKLTDQVIQQKADDVLTKGIQNIRDSFGVAQAAEKGSQIGPAVGAAGAEGVSLTEPGANQPVALNRLGNKITGLTEAYQQGGLSNSAYYAKLETFVRETKAQFPGYSDQIDSMVATKVGTTPANALRSSLLQDVTNLQAKVQAQNDKWTTYEHANTQYIHTQWPNYEQLKAEGRAPSRLEIEASVGKQQASDYKFEGLGKRLAVMKGTGEAQKEQAADVLGQKGSEISRNVIIGMTNTMGIQSGADFMKYMDDVNSGKRAPPTPDEKTQLTGLFSILKQKANAQFDAFANKPLAENTTETWASRVGDKGRIDNARSLALSDLSTIEDGLLNDKHGLVASTMLHNKAVEQITDETLLKQKNIALAGGIRRQIGDQALSAMYIGNSDFLQGTMEAVRQSGWVDMSQGKSARETLENIKDQSHNSGAQIKQHIKDATGFVINKDTLSDPTLADTAFKHLYGAGNRTLIDSFDGKVQTNVFTDLVSPKMTKAVAKRSKEDQTTFVNFAEDGFTSVFQTQAMGANQSAENFKVNGNLSLKYDPDAQQFKYEGGGKLPLFPGNAPQRTVQVANQTLAPLNSAIASMKEVFKMTGKDPTAELYRLLPIAGIEPGTPIYKTIQSEFLKTQKTEEK